MGDVEDTFTKQEIQAGYVTSGRDVLARQQQIVQQALSAASGAAGGAPRRKTGSGGPSGTGRASSHPVFPAPTFDEPAKSPPPLVPPPSAAAKGRSVSAVSAAASSTAFPPITAAVSSSGTHSAAPSTIARAASVGLSSNLPKTSVGHASRKSAGTGTISAASVVAGVHSVNSEPPAPHTTLTPLTPLKRSSVAKGATKSSDSNGLGGSVTTTKLTNLRVGKKNGVKIGSAPGSPATENTSAKTQSHGRYDGPSSIGGAIIAAPAAVAPPVGLVATSSGAKTPASGSLAALGGEPLSGLGGEVFNGPLKSFSNKSAIGNGAPIGSSKDKWNSSSIGGDPVVPASAPGLWGNGGNIGSQGLAPGPQRGQVGGNVIGGGAIGGGFQGSGSSTLAGMLGINLPTGSGSLRESSDLWGTPSSPQQAPIAALNGSSMPVQGVIGAGSSNPNNGLIGGVTIGAPGPMGSGVMGGGGNKNDIALLQSLLPGVHITSGGGTYNQGSSLGTIGGGNDWNSSPGPNHPMQRPMNNGMQQQPQHWSGGVHSLGGTPIGAIGQTTGKQNERQAPGSIW